MEISLIAAKLLGIYLVISGWFLISRGKTVANLLKDFFGHPAIVYLTGVTLIFLSSLLLLIGNNIWDGSWRVIITIFVWVTLLKGLAYIFFPEQLHKIVSRKILGNLSIFGVISIVIGLCLFYIR